MNKLRRKALTNASETLTKPIAILTDLHDSGISTGSYKDYTVIMGRLVAINMKSIKDTIETIDCFYSDVDMLCDEERDYMDNMPENLQNSERYYTAEECVDLMESIIDYQSEVVENLNSFCESRKSILDYMTQIVKAYPSDKKSDDFNIDIIEKVFDIYNNGEDEDSIYMDDVPKDYPFDFMNETMDKICELLEDISTYISESITIIEDVQNSIDDIVML